MTYSGRAGWSTRAHAALLYAGPDAVLGAQASAYLHGFVRVAPEVIDVLVPERRRVAAQQGLVIRRRVAPQETIRSAPARLRREPTVLELAESARDTDAAVGVLCDAFRVGCDLDALRQALAGRSRVRRRRLLCDLLAVVEAGVESPLEYRYDRDVERPHGLPRSQPQLRQVVGGRWIRADRVFIGLGTRVELDGRLAHPGGATDDDVWRDNGVRIERRELTLRYRWRHIAGHPCDTAVQVAAALGSQGWAGRPRPCGPGCPVAA